MKTIVVAEVGGKLVTLPLSDLGAPLVRGRVFLLGGQRLRVGEVLEYLGSHDLNGKPISGNEKLVALLTDVYKDVAVAIAKMADLTSIGSDAPKNPSTSGGIIIPSQAPQLVFDNVIFITWDSGLARVSIPAHSIADASQPVEASGDDDGLAPVDAAQATGYSGA